MYVEIELKKKKKKKKKNDFESLVLRKFRKITAISHPCMSNRMCRNKALQAMHSVHLEPTWRVWHGVVQDVKR